MILQNYKKVKIISLYKSAKDSLAFRINHLPFKDLALKNYQNFENG